MDRIGPKLEMSVDDVRISRLLGAIRMMLIDVILQKSLLSFGSEITLC